MPRAILALLLGLAACKPGGSSGETVLVNETVTIEPGKFVTWAPYTDHDCEFEFYVTAEGPGVEFWAGPGPGGMAIIDSNASSDKKAGVPGKTESWKASCPIGKLNANVLNRGTAPVKVKCKLVTIKPKKP